MALTKLQFRPGINREGTNYSGEGGWYACNLIRFRLGFPEKIGGWARVSTSAFLGVCRNLWNWLTLAGSNLIAIGTTVKYYIYGNSAFNDVTPLRDFTATGTYIQTASTTLTVTITSHLVTTGDTVILWFTTGAATSGSFAATVTGANTFTVQTTTGTTSGNVTLRRNTSSLTNPFTTVSGSLIVTVTQTGHGALTNDYVTFAGFSAFNNIPAAELNTEKQITYVSSSTYTITVTTTPNASSAGGGTGTAQYQINVGLVDYVSGIGWGQDPWGASATAWGQSSALGPGGQLRLWTTDNFGQDLIACVRGSSLYYWTIGGIYTFSRATYLTDSSFAAGYDGQFVPSTSFQAIASDAQRIIVAIGANSYDSTNSATTFDPMLVRWSDQENPFEWVPAATNQAGEQRLTLGSYLMVARTSRQEILIWSDTAVYSMQYLGPPYVFGFTVLADNISIASPNASIVANGVTYWMGVDKFYQYSGRTETLSCTLWRHVFKNINLSQIFKVTVGLNEGFNEIWWNYPSASATENDSYVVYNYVENLWYYGSLIRTSWLDSPLQMYPMATDASNRLLYQEYGIDDDSTGTPAGMSSYVQSSDFDIGDGNKFMFVWRTIPDVTFDGSTTGVSPAATMTLYPRKNPGDSYGTSAAPVVTGAVYPLDTYTSQIMTRLRGRQMSFKISSTGIGTNWQLGVPRIDAREDGRKV